MPEVILQRWKGKDHLDFDPVPGGYVVIQHRKEKETGTVRTITHMVSSDTIQTLRRIIREHCVYGVEYAYGFIVSKLIAEYELDTAEGIPTSTMMACFNGGRFREKYYFPLYYYPMKVLEHEGFVNYYGKGGFSLRGLNDEW